MTIALTNATVVPCTGEQPLEQATVLVEGDRIAWIGPSADVPESGAEQVDCTGKTILPGLCDAHAHLVYDDVQDAYTIELAKPVEQAAVDGALHAAKLLRLGFTSMRDVGTRGNIAVIVRDEVARGRLPGPRMKASKQIISVWGGLGDFHPTHIFKREQYATALTEIVTGPWEARNAVRQQVKDGVDWVKVEASGTGFNPLCPAERDTISAEELRAVVRRGDGQGQAGRLSRRVPQLDHQGRPGGRSDDRARDLPRRRGPRGDPRARRRRLPHARASTPPTPRKGSSSAFRSRW